MNEVQDNGAAMLSAEEADRITQSATLKGELEAPIASLRTLIAECRARRDEALVEAEVIAARVKAIEPELKRYEKALALLLDQVPPSPLRGRPRGQRVREKPAGLSEERVVEWERAIRAYAEHHEEFRQVDVRATMTGTVSKSSVAAMACEVLRQRNVIRIARVQGNSKYYRLTREAMRAEV
jgi:hypothetical protein